MHRHQSVLCLNKACNTATVELKALPIAHAVACIVMWPVDLLFSELSLTQACVMHQPRSRSKVNLAGVACMLIL